MGCYGDGGAVFTNDDDIAALIRSLCVHGKSELDKYNNLRLGMNSRLDTIQAAVLDVKLSAFEDYELKKVNAAAKMYTERLDGKLDIPVVPEGFYSSWAQYTVQLPDREKRDQGSGGSQGAGHPLHDLLPQVPCTSRGLLRSFLTGEIALYPSGSAAGSYPCPLHPYLTEEDADQVCGALLSLL